MSNACRPLTEEEIELMFKTLSGAFALRNRVLFELGLTTGFRVSEIISLRVKDVMEFNKIKNSVKVEAKFMKGGKKSRVVLLKDSLKKTLTKYIATLGNDPNLFLFPSRQGGENKPMSARAVEHMLDKLKQALQLQGSIGTHCMRKTYAYNVWEITNHDIYAVMKALGHSSIDTTLSYLPDIEQEVQEKIRMASKGSNYGHYDEKLGCS